MPMVNDANVWELLFGPEETRQAEAAQWIKEVSGRDPARPKTDGDALPAMLGILWVNSSSDIYYDIRINGIPLEPPNAARGGRLVREIHLNKGNNRLDWTIHHTRQGWQDAVYIKLGDRVTKLHEARSTLGRNGTSTAANVVIEAP